MKTFVQSAILQQIRDAASAGLADGVVLSPIDLALDDPSAEIVDRLAEIGSEFATPVCVPVSAVLGGDIYRDGRELARAADQVIVLVPFVEDAISPIRRLVADGIRVCATHIYSGAQAFIAAKMGAMMVAVEVQDADAHGYPSADLVAQIRLVLDQSGLECDLAVTAAVNAVCFTNYLLAGADTAFVTPDLLNALMVHSLTDRGVDRYLNAISKRHKPRTL